MTFAVCGFSILLGSQSIYSQSLHEKIDAISQKPASPLSAIDADDGIFLRRLSLDLRNAVPTTEERIAFLADADPNKRIAWTERMLTDPLFAERIVTWLDLTLMERRPAAQVQRQPWLDWLRSKVDQATPIDQLSREVLTASWWKKEDRTQQRFFLDRGGDPHLITRDVGRIFLGRDMQCAQCHDHPIVDDYRQRDYHGLLAYFSQSASTEVTYKDAEGKDVKVIIYAEKAPADAAFESVFDKGKPHWMGPALPLVTTAWEPFTPPAHRYQAIASDWITAPVLQLPATSRRERLAKELTDPGYRPFAENWANRLWAMMLGRGIVHPLDMHHAHNPPVDRALLQVLTDGLIECKFDIKTFIREIALSKTYQRGNHIPLDDDRSILQSVDIQPIQGSIAAIEADIQSLKEKARNEKSELKTQTDAMTAIDAEHVRLRGEVAKVEAAWNDAVKKVAEQTAARDKAAKPVADTKAKQTLLAEAAAKLEQAKALTGEDAELAAAIATTVAKRDATVAQLPPLEASLQAAESALQGLVAVEKVASDQMVAAGANLETIKEQVVAKSSELIRLRDQWRRTCNQEILALQVLAKSAKWVEWRKANDTIAQSATALAGAQTQINTLAMQRTEIESGLNTLVTQAAEKTKEKNVSLQSQTTENEKIAAITGELEQLQATQQQLLASKSLLSNPAAIDPSLAELEQSLGQRRTALDQSKATLVQLTTQMTTIESQLVELGKQQQSQSDAMTANQSALQAAQESLADLQQSVESARSTMSECERVLHDRSEIELQVARLKPLSPEQLCWSILRVMGIFDSFIANEMAELDKQSPLPAEPPATEQELQERRKLAVRRAVDKLRGNADAFANLYAGGAGQVDNFFASAEQALFVMNGGSVYSWSGPSGANLTSRVAQNADVEAAVGVMYETLLARKPSPAELAAMVNQLNVPAEQKGARAQEAVWALLSSAEFRFAQ